MTAERSRVDESTARGIVPRAATIPAILVLVMFWGLAAIPAQAQIGTPVDLGSNQADGVDGATVTSLKIKTSADAPAGSSVIVMALDLGMDRNALSALSVTCTDSAAHTYKTDVSLKAAPARFLSTHQIAATLPVGSAITVIWSGQSGLNSYRIRAFAVTGLASNPLDQTASPSNNFNSLPSSGTVTTTQASELLVGAISVLLQSATPASVQEPATPRLRALAAYRRRYSGNTALSLRPGPTLLRGLLP